MNNTCIGMVMFIILIIGLLIFNNYQTKKLNKKREQDDLQIRWNYLCKKYGIEDATKIYRRTIWLGATEDMLIDSFGQPVEIDNDVSLDRIRKTYKYKHLGYNRFQDRIFIENGIVIGWKD